MHSLYVGQTTFYYNGDFSGDVSICQGDDEMKVPIESLNAFFAELLRSRKISMIESMTDQQIIEEAGKSL